MRQRVMVSFAVLAARNNAKLITLDAKIPGSVFIG